MSDNDRWGCFNNGMAENFRQSHAGRIDRAGVQFDKLLDAVAGVQDHDPEFFPRGISHEWE